MIRLALIIGGLMNYSDTEMTEDMLKVNSYVNAFSERRVFDKNGYKFYFALIDKLKLEDADRYAALNTMLGYDVGLDNFIKIKRFLERRYFDLMQITPRDLWKIKLASLLTKTELDFSNWHKDPIENYEFYHSCDK